MKAIIKTANGQVYVFDDEKLTWVRKETELVGVEGGDLAVFPHVELGERAMVLGVDRTVLTGPVVEITYCK